MTISRHARAFLRHATPAMGETGRAELVRATFGAGLAMGLSDILLWILRHYTPGLAVEGGDPLSEVMIVSPFAATAFLILTLPNSPLAQPWSVIVGNTVGAAAGVICAAVLSLPVISAILAVGLSVLFMAKARALHPPGAAMALNVVLISQSDGYLGPGFALTTVIVGSILLIVFGMIFNPLTGRRYPFRPADEAPAEEIPTLAAMLERFKLSANIGVADLSRLIATLEAEATAKHLGQITAARMMTPSPVSLPRHTPVDTIAGVFRDCAYRTIPIVDADGRYLGLVQHMSLVGASPTATAETLMTVAPGVEPETGMTDILALLTSGRLRVVAVVREGILIGIITRSDLIDVLARALRGSSVLP